MYLSHESISCTIYDLRDATDAIIDENYKENDKDTDKYKNIYVFDKNKNRINDVYRNGNGDTIKNAEYDYDNSGNLVMYILFDDENVIGKIEYKYDNKGFKTKEIMYMSNSQLYSTKLYVNDDFGNEVELTEKFEWDSVEHISMFNYQKYDKLGNWLIKGVFSNGKTGNKTVREIKYWDR